MSTLQQPSGDLPDPWAPHVGDEHAALLAELDEVRDAIVDRWSEGEASTGRELLGAVLAAVPLLFVVVVVVAFLFPPEGVTRQDNLPQLLVGIPVAVLAAWLLRGTIRRQRAAFRAARRLRRREREILAALPPGRYGQSAYRRWIDNRFGHPALFALFASAMFMVFVLPVLIRRF